MRAGGGRYCAGTGAGSRTRSRNGSGNGRGGGTTHGCGRDCNRDRGCHCDCICDRAHDRARCAGVTCGLLGSVRHRTIRHRARSHLFKGSDASLALPFPLARCRSSSTVEQQFACQVPESFAVLHLSFPLGGQCRGAGGGVLGTADATAEAPAQAETDVAAAGDSSAAILDTGREDVRSLRLCSEAIRK